MGTQKIVHDLGLAGFVLNHSKSNLKPQQVGPWLGFQLDLNKGMFYVPEEKLLKLISSIKVILIHNRVCVRKLASIVGQTISMSLAIGPVSRLRTRALYHVLNSRRYWSDVLPLSCASRDELLFWKSSLPYQKPLNRYLYIPFNSYHPNHSKRSFIKAELIRYVRLSSKVSDFLKIRDSFYNRLRNRGYPKWFLTEIFSEVSYNLRSSYLSVKKNRASGLAHKLFFKTNRNPLFNGVHLRKLFLFHLCNDFDVTICYKATPNLAKFVSRKLFRAT